MGKLVVIVMGCKDLKAADLGQGHSDPFVTLTIGATEYKTAIIKNTLAPKFDETFTFTNATMDGTMSVKVWDDDALTKDALGETEVHLDTLVKGQSVSLWLPLRGVETGKVGLRMHAIDFGADPAKAVVRAGGVSLESLCAELGTEFSRDLITKLCAMLRRHDVNGDSSFTMEEFTDFMQELYFVTGTTVPTDDALHRNIKELFQKYDKDHNASIDIREFCAMMKESKLKEQVKGKWRAGGVQGAGGSLAVKGPGKTWSGSLLPKPGAYPGYRATDGTIVERTKIGKGIPGIEPLKTEPAPKSVIEKKSIVEQTMADCDLRYCQLESCVVTRGKITGGFLECCSLEGVEITNVKALRSCYLRNCVLFNVHPADCGMDGCVVKNGIVYNCSFLDCEIREITGHSSAFQRCKMYSFVDEGNNAIDNIV